MSKHSAGLLMYRWQDGNLEVFIAHPGGPFHENLDEGDWSIPKGIVEKGEDAFEAAVREFQEETGLPPPPGDCFPLGRIRQKSGKLVDVWAFKSNTPEGWRLDSNLFEMEWPKGSGKTERFPEMDKAGFFSLDEAKKKLNPAQVEFLDRLILHIGKEMASRAR